MVFLACEVGSGNAKKDESRPGAKKPRSRVGPEGERETTQARVAEVLPRTGDRSDGVEGGIVSVSRRQVAGGEPRSPDPADDGREESSEDKSSAQPQTKAYFDFHESELLELSHKFNFDDLQGASTGIDGVCPTALPSVAMISFR